ncbi:MAG: hypothetical protein WCL04_05675 [Verrucomicrobiota bacterium]
MDDPDLQLLTRYARHGDEAAFAEVLHHYLDLVHSVALRHVHSAAQHLHECARPASQVVTAYRPALRLADFTSR